MSLNKSQKQIVVFVGLLCVTGYVAFDTFFANSTSDTTPIADKPNYAQAVTQVTAPGVSQTGSASSQAGGQPSQQQTAAPVRKEFNFDAAALVNDLVSNSPNQKEGFLSIAAKESARLAELSAVVAQQQAITAKANYEKEEVEYKLERLKDQRVREQEERARRDRVPSIAQGATALPTANIDYSKMVGQQSGQQVTTVVKPPVPQKRKPDWDPSVFEVRGVVSVDEGLMAHVFYKSVRQSLVVGSKLENGDITVRKIVPGQIQLDVDGETKTVYFNM